MAKIDSLQKEIIQQYRDGQFAFCQGLYDVKNTGDTLFNHVLKEAKLIKCRNILIESLKRSASDLQNLADSLSHENHVEIRQSIPLADRYANRVMDGTNGVVCIEVGGVRYTDSGAATESCFVKPDFYSVYARIRDEKTNDAGVRCIGDFISQKAAREYAVHVSSWHNPPWDVHELSAAGWIPLPEVAKA